MSDQLSVYSGDNCRSSQALLEELIALTELHMSKCVEFERICSTFFPHAGNPSTLEELPYIPVGLFKSLTLSSVPESDVYQTLMSSGTTGTPSRVVLDRGTATAQTRWLTSTMKFWLGEKRRRMLIVDSSTVLSGSTAKSARAAAILGMMRFGKDVHWLLDEAGKVDRDGLDRWIKERPDEPLFVFGFTFMVWQHLIQDLRTRSIDLSNAVLFHGGGWKMLASEAVSASEFRLRLRDQFGISQVHDYYGMVEQLGCIWIEVEEGLLVPTARSAALIRDPRTLCTVPVGTPGLVQVFSSLPRSYPGHSILTEDLGLITQNTFRPEIFGDHGLRILGRLPKSQARGCSDAVHLRGEFNDD